MRRSWAILGIVLFFLMVASTAFATAPEISTDDLKAKMDTSNIIVINPLSLIEHNNLQIEGSINIIIPDLKAKLPADKSIPLAFYCLGRK